MSNYREQGVIFQCGENRLVGITAIPDRPAEAGVLILVGGPQYRVGSHRQFTLLARSLAEAGFASLRFDYTGMGDSEGCKREFDQNEEDIAAAIESFLENVPEIRQVVLWALCDAASSAMIFAHRHPRVTGMILLNPWVHNGEYPPEVKLAHYYRSSISRLEQWRRLLFGKIELIPAFRELAKDILVLFVKYFRRYSRQIPGRSFVNNMLDGLQHFQHGILIVLSETDLTAQEFSTLIAHDAAWKAAISKPTISIKTVLAADHTFSRRPWSEQVSQMSVDWLAR